MTVLFYIIIRLLILFLVVRFIVSIVRSKKSSPIDKKNTWNTTSEKTKRYKSNNISDGEYHEIKQDKS